jgi:hypothetical protein
MQLQSFLFEFDAAPQDHGGNYSCRYSLERIHSVHIGDLGVLQFDIELRTGYMEAKTNNKSARDPSNQQRANLLKMVAYDMETNTFRFGANIWETKSCAFNYIY